MKIVRKTRTFVGDRKTTRRVTETQTRANFDRDLITILRPPRDVLLVDRATLFWIICLFQGAIHSARETSHYDSRQLTRPLNLANMPVDIHELIVYYVTAAEPMGPPHGLLALASTCWNLYYSLSIKHNALVYADTFRLKFDTAAPLRRFASESAAVEARTSTSGLASELRARFAALHYMRTVVDTQNVFCFSERETLLHLWTIYFMCIESDSKNQKYLVTYGQMRTYARLCMDQYLFQSLDAPDLLPETTERSLMMWISWFSTTWGTLTFSPGQAVFPRV